MDTTQLQAQLQGALQGLNHWREHSRGDIRGRIIEEILRGPLQADHEANSGAIEFDSFDTNPSATDAQITAVVGAGNDLTLFAQTSAQNEAGVIIVQRANQWVIDAGTGGSQGWGIVDLQWSLNGPGANFNQQYDAMPSGGYSPADVFAMDYAKLNAYKALHGKTIISGGSIVVKMVVRPLGPVGSTVVWHGATLTAISSAACNMWQKMVTFGPGSYGPISVPSLFHGCSQQCDGESARPGKRQIVAGLFGNGALGSFIHGIKHIVAGPPPQTQPPGSPIV